MIGRCTHGVVGRLRSASDTGSLDKPDGYDIAQGKDYMPSGANIPVVFVTGLRSQLIMPSVEDKAGRRACK